MRQFKNPTGLMRAAAIALWIDMVLDPIHAVLRYVDPTTGGSADIAEIVWLLELIVCMVLVGRWIYRTNSNAHVLSSEMTMTPGWSVGWFFVPFANLVMPYQGVKETWRESHEAAGYLADVESPLLPWWWGLWIATNVLGNLSAMFGGGTSEPLEGAAYVDLLTAALNVPLCLILIRLMTRLSRIQVMASEGSVFA